MPELPPYAFSNLMNSVNPKFDYTNWRKSPEWRIFVAGYNAALEGIRSTAVTMKNLGVSEYRVFGQDI